MMHDARTAEAPPSPQRGGGTTNVLLMMIVGAMLLGSGCVGGFLAGWFAAMANSLGGVVGDMVAAEAALAEIEVILEEPESVRVGEPFELAVVVENTGSTPRQIATVDLNGAICDQFDVIGVDPRPSDRTLEYGWHEYVYHTPIPAGGSRTFTFSMRARAPGTHTGDVSVYIGASYHEIARPVTITAQAAALPGS